MATLTSALNYAVSGLSVASAQSAAAARNIAFARDADYSRRSADIVSLPGGGAGISAFSRSANKLLLDQLLAATSRASGRDATFDSISRLGQTVGDPQDATSVAALVANLQVSLRSFEADPSSPLLASASVTAAKAMASSLNDASNAIQAVRQQADDDMATSVSRINTLLEQFKIANDAVVRGSGTTSDLSDSLDQRDRILKTLSEELGIRTITRSNNDLAIYTDGGVTLFEGTPRKVEFAPTTSFDATTLGAAVFVDGVKITGGPSPMPALTGKLAALAEIRDTISNTFQLQLDETARGLIAMFAETDQGIPPALPDVAGLFTDDSSTALPLASTTPTGLASRITINALADPASGGNPALIRDGGFGGPSYVYNATAAPSFQSRLTQLQGSFDGQLPFQSEAGLGTSASIKSFSAGSAGWIESLRQSSNAARQTGLAQKTRSTEALSRVTGVNIDEEMSAILDLEKSYQASAKIIAAINSMLNSLMEAVG